VDEVTFPDVARATDGELIEAARRASAGRSDELLDVLYRRWYARVARWCLKTCGSRETAADLAQEVFLRVHERLDTFRGDSAFSTWLYTVMRRVAINRGIAAKRRRETPSSDLGEPAAVDPDGDAATRLERAGELERLREAMKRDLDPIEARVLYLHYVDGLTLPAITRLLDLTNKSGAKAYVVSGKRKLRRGLAVHASRERAMLRSV